MKIVSRLLLTAALTALGEGCARSPADAPTHATIESDAVTVDDALVQFSLVAALAARDYVGTTPLRKVLSSGDFGIGTFDRLDGEMIVLDGEMFQALADGTVRAADLQGTTPFAAVTFFKEDGRVDHIDAATLTDLEEQLDRQIPHRNAPHAIRVDCECSELTVRSVPAQSPPFQPLVEIVKHQPTWEHRNVRGTLVGLRCPAWVGTLNVSGYHWHFLSDDHKMGGHVLACKVRDGLVRFDECTSIVIQLPQSVEFDHFDVDEVGKRDIEQIERQRSEAGPP